MTQQETGSRQNRQWRQFKLQGDLWVRKLKGLVHEGNVRRIIIRDEQGQTFMEVPLTIGVVGTVLLPIWTALGALAALAQGFAIKVEKGHVGEGIEKAPRHAVKGPGHVPAAVG
jgi:hypothetical protein